MKPYDQLDITDLVLEGDSDAIEKLEAEIQDRDRAIVELWARLEWIMPYHNDAPADKESLEMVEKYADFVTKTRAIYGL